MSLPLGGLRRFFRNSIRALSRRSAARRRPRSHRRVSLGVETLEARLVLSTTSPVPGNLTAVANALSHSDEHYDQFITAAYEKYLGRAPDAAGLNGWLQGMKHGLSDERLEAGFLGAPEYIADHGGTWDGWVKGMYQDLLGRTPGQAEVSAWVSYLRLGGSPQQVAYGFAASAEREGMRVRDDYQTFLGRSPSQAEVAGWVNGFTQGISNEDVVGGFVGSPENFARHGSNSESWIEGAFLSILGRSPSPDEVQTWSRVLEVTVGNFSLQNGTLSNTGSGQVIGQSVKSFGVRSDGDTYLLRANNEVVLVTPTGQPLSDLGVAKAFATTGNGQVVMLNNLGNLYEHTPGTSGSDPLIGSNIKAVGVAGNGDLMALSTSDGNGKLFLEERTPDGKWIRRSGDDLVSFAIGGNGDVMALSNSDGSSKLFLEEMDPNGTWTRISSDGVSSFAIGGDGKAYFLQADGSLWHGSTQVASSVVSFAVGGDGKAYFLQTNGYLWHEGAPANPLTDAGELASSVQSFAIGGDGRAYFLQADGYLWHDGAPPCPLNPLGDVAHNVQAFAIAGDGRAYILQTDGYLWHADEYGGSLVASSVASFAVAGDGKAYFLQKNGYLWHEGAPANPLTDAGELASSVQAFAIGGDGKAYFLQTDGYLWHDGAPPCPLNPLGDVAHNVQAFAIAGDGRAYILQTNGYLWHADENGGTEVASGVQSFEVGSDGKAYYLQNGSLYHEGASNSLATSLRNFLLTNGGTTLYYQTMASSQVYRVRSFTDTVDGQPVNPDDKTVPPDVRDIIFGDPGNPNDRTWTPVVSPSPMPTPSPSPDGWDGSGSSENPPGQGLPPGGGCL